MNMELEEVKPKIQSVSAKTDHDGIFSSNEPDWNTSNSNVKFTKPSQFMTATMKLKAFMKKHFDKIILIGKLLLIIGYFVYFGFALSYHVRDEGSWRLISCTILAIWIISWNLFKNTRWYSGLTSLGYDEYLKGKRSLIIRWFLYVSMTLFMVVYVIIYVAMKTPDNLRSLFGVFAFPLLLFVFSNNRRKVNWHTIYWAVTFHFILALLILKTTWGASSINWCGDRLDLVSNRRAGSVFIFGEKYTDHPFVFKSMVQVFVIIVGLSVLTYLGVIKYIVETVGRALAFCIGTSPPEGINAVGNVFLHVPESAMLVQEYLPDMTPSQLFVTYADGLSTVGGVALVIFMSSGQRSEIIATYALCGAASFAVMGLIIGTFEVIVPHRIEEITQNILGAMIVGTLASYLTACFAGLLFGEGIGTFK